ncbi:MAG TPA: hypothetical protein VF739_05880 [Ktedonobacterales bacterium]
MQRDDEDDLRASSATGNEPLAENAQESDEAETRGREVEDVTRAGETHGRDVLTDAERPDIESHGRDVVDSSHNVETRGVDVIDLGPATSTGDEPRQP